MRIGSLKLTAFVLALCPGMLAVQASAQTPHWEPWKIENLSKPDNQAAGLKEIWSDVIAKNNAAWTNPAKDPRFRDHAPALVFYETYSFNQDGREISLIVSSMLGAHVGCDTGVNDSKSDAIAALCPARIAVIEGGQLAVHDAGSVCVVPEPGLLNRDPADNNAFVAVSDEKKTVYFMALKGGHEVDGCTFQTGFSK